MGTRAHAADRVILDCRGALASPSVVHAARGPSPLTVRLIVGHGAGVSGEPRPGRPDGAGTRGRLLDGRLPTGCLQTPG
jgi:hypothetical protein